MIEKPAAQERASTARRAAESAIAVQHAAARRAGQGARFARRGVQLLFSGCFTALFFAGFLAAGTLAGQLKALALTAAVALGFLLFFRWSWRRA